MRYSVREEFEEISGLRNYAKAQSARVTELEKVAQINEAAYTRIYGDVNRAIDVLTEHRSQVPTSTQAVIDRVVAILEGAA